MKSVGIKVLKNQLSRYLDMVREGELIYVTDREEVIAEIRRPSRMASGQSRYDEYVDQQARAGLIVAAKRRDATSALPKRTPQRKIDVQALLDETREDRS